MILRAILAFFTVLVLSSGCNEYNKIVKSDDLNLKYEAVERFYKNAEYLKAYPMIEELLTYYRGTNRAEKLYYYYAYCDYYLEDYYLASHHFKLFTKRYPASKWTEECQFMSAYCNYKASPTFSLDQSNTTQAINELQVFANKFPKSNLLDSANTLIDVLRLKLEKKTYALAYQYYHMRNYQSAITSFKNLLEEFPNTENREKVLYLIQKSGFLLAENSVNAKKLERYEDATKAYVKFVDSYPESDYIKEAESIYDKSVKRIESIKNNSL
jgi:outer membrane protein assembly factor BamD